MRSHHLFGSILAAGIVACSTDGGTTAPVIPDPPAPQGPAVFLREIQIPSLPSPYYHFEYDTQGRISVASFAAGMARYDVHYAGDRITELVDTGLSPDKLEYLYDTAGRVDSVKYLDGTGALFEFVTLSYKGNQLVGLQRRRKLGAAFALEKEMSFSYYADGNLEQITDHRPAVEDRQPESTSIDRFEQYDTGINVDGFGLIHNDFFDHLVLLPNVVLQKGNPAKETFTSDFLSYTATYSYTYDDGRRPLSKNGAATFTSGDDAGKTFQVLSLYSYY